VVVPKPKLYVSDLKSYLTNNQISPEHFAKTVSLSQMTIRRWLNKGARSPLPIKYLPLLGPYFGKSEVPEPPKASVTQALENLSLSTLMDDLKSTGEHFAHQTRDLTRRKALKKVEEEVELRLKHISSDQMFTDCCSKLMKAARSAKTKPKARAIATGALLYFAKPVCTPEETPLIGYLGELTVLSVALNQLDSADC